MTKVPKHGLFFSLGVLAITILLSIAPRVESFSRSPKVTRNNRVAIRSSLCQKMVVSSYDLTGKSSSSSISSSLASDSPMILDPLVIVGPSGVGKGTLIARFQDDFPELAKQFGFTVSHTTRQPRPGEVNGVHYHFVSVEEMKILLARDAFLESAQVHKNYYGTSWQALRDVQQQGKRCLLDIDVQGVQRLKLLQESWSIASNDASSLSKPSFLLQPKYLFISPPSLETLQDRLRKRNTESPEALQTRLANAAAEVAYGKTAGNFDAVVVNDDLEKAVEDFAKAVRRVFQL
mmetsp:Transcript_20929/g.39742  ORF Transcript_20929/g.39742 Transcript_20929/m.39742 type:complete len:291 (+) Transcript_20929:224-1096(+)